MKWTTLIFGALFGLACILTAEACNEAVCASRVSKCMLIKCCECDMTDKRNCSCCMDCQVCLDNLYTECCSCVGMCPQPDNDMDLFKTSSIETLSDPIPELFDVLTEDPDYLKRWMTYKYPRHQTEENLKTGSKNLEFAIVIGEDDVKPSVKPLEVDSNTNCTVAFFSQCMSIKKCKASCKSMGAAKYRWFHEYGCCQCVGDTCISFGLGEPHCLHCPSANDIEESEFEVEMVEHDMKADVKEQVRVAGGRVSGGN